MSLDDLPDPCTGPELEKALKLHPGYLAKRRCTAGAVSPPWIKIGALVRYRKADVLRFLDENRKNPAMAATPESQS